MCLHVRVFALLKTTHSKKEWQRARERNTRQRNSSCRTDTQRLRYGLQRLSARPRSIRTHASSRTRSRCPSYICACDACTMRARNMEDKKKEERALTQFPNETLTGPSCTCRHRVWACYMRDADV